MSATTVGEFIILCGGCTQNQQCPADAPFCYCPEVSDSVVAYNPTSNAFSTLASLPTPRYRHAAATYANDLYVFGGRDVDDNVVTQVDKYDAAGTKTWTTLTATLPYVASDWHSFTIASNVYITGGYNADYSVTYDSVIKFDASAGTFQTMSQTMGTARGDHATVAIGDKGYVFGGFSADWCVPLHSLEEFDPSTNTWSTKADMQFNRADKAGAALGGKFWVIGGETPEVEVNCTGNQPTTDVEAYDPTTNAWEGEAAIPSHRFRFSAAEFAPMNAIFVFGGQGAAEPMSGGGSEYPVADMVEMLVVDGDTTGTNGATSGPAVSVVAVIAAASVALLAALI